MWQHHPLCDLQDTYTGMSLYDHLHYRYIMALEGNDVATNLKWIMSSNSIAVMPRPTCETWFMEGRLIPNYHYIEIADDFHDLSVTSKCRMLRRSRTFVPFTPLSLPLKPLKP